MFGGKKKNEFPIGLDVGSAGVKMLQLSLRGGALQATAAAYVPLSAGLKPGTEAYNEALAAAIGSGIERGGFAGNRVVSALPASVMQCKNLRLPMMPSDELDSAVKWEAADRFRMDASQCSVQYLHAGHVNQGDETRQELILLAAKLNLVEDHVAAMTRNHLRPLAIDSTPTALARLTVLSHTDSAEDRGDGSAGVVIDAGQSSTKVLIAVDGQVRFYKSIEIGGEYLDSVLSGEMSISLEEAKECRSALSATQTDGETGAKQAKVIEALRPTIGELAREIGLCLRYYGVTFRGARPTLANLVGGAATPWLAEELAEMTGLTVQTDVTLGRVDYSALGDVIRPGKESAWAVAAGLSIREHMRTLTPETREANETSVFSNADNTQGVAA